MAGPEYTGIFAFEGDWTPDDLEDKSSMRPTLETLRDVCDVDFIHRRIGTVAELEYYVDKWLSEGVDENYDDYRVGYFAFHGSRGVIAPGEGDVTLDQLAVWIDGRAQGRTVYFGSCSTLDLDTKRVKDFLKATKAKAAGGYTTDVNWLQSAAFDLLVLDALACYHRRPHAANNYLWKHYKAFATDLGLKIVTPSSKS